MRAKNFFGLFRNVFEAISDRVELSAINVGNGKYGMRSGMPEFVRCNQLAAMHPAQRASWKSDGARLVNIYW